jgi:RNA polymerase sigma-70 factor (ECF subfamily)
VRDDGVEVDDGRARGGDGFARFFERERAPLFALVYALCRTTQPAVAEDIVQDAFVRAFERWSDVANYDRPELWLRHVAINLTTSRYRRLMTEVRRLSALRAGDAMLLVPGESAAVLAALKGLPRRQLQVLALRYVDEMTTDEIAEVLGVAPGTVRTHLRRGHDALRRDPRLSTSMRERVQ